MVQKRSRQGEAVANPDVQYWLMKSEPDAFSIDDLKQKGTSPWDGVRNYAARNNMKAMKLNDIVLFYHSNAKPSGIVGLAKVCRLAYPDFTATDPTSKYYDKRTESKPNPWEMVDVSFIESFPAAAIPKLSLHALREDPQLQSMQLFSRGRLSVQSVEAPHFSRIMSIVRAIK